MQWSQKNAPLVLGHLRPHINTESICAESDSFR